MMDSSLTGFFVKLHPKALKETPSPQLFNGICTLLNLRNSNKWPDIYIHAYYRFE